MSPQVIAMMGAIAILALGLLLVIYFARLGFRLVKRIFRPTIPPEWSREGGNRDGL
jgi:hypothetical protein